MRRLLGFTLGDRIAAVEREAGELRRDMAGLRGVLDAGFETMGEDFKRRRRE